MLRCDRCGHGLRETISVEIAPHETIIICDECVKNLIIDEEDMVLGLDKDEMYLVWYLLNVVEDEFDSEPFEESFGKEFRSLKEKVREGIRNDYGREGY